MVADRKRAKRLKLSAGKLEQFIKLNNGRDAIIALGAERVAAERKRLKRDKRNLKRIVPHYPDSPWFDAKWDDDTPFPPGGDATTMRMCRDCGRYTPPNCISSRDVCIDCQHDYMTPTELAGLPVSCSKINVAAMKAAARAGRQYTGGF